MKIKYNDMTETARTEWLNQCQKDSGFVCPSCLKYYMDLKKGQFGQFWGCGGYPKCEVTIHDTEARNRFIPAMRDVGVNCSMPGEPVVFERNQLNMVVKVLYDAISKKIMSKIECLCQTIADKAIESRIGDYERKLQALRADVSELNKKLQDEEYFKMAYDVFEDIKQVVSNRSDNGVFKYELENNTIFIGKHEYRGKYKKHLPRITAHFTDYADIKTGYHLWKLPDGETNRSTIIVKFNISPDDVIQLVEEVQSGMVEQELVNV